MLLANRFGQPPAELAPRARVPNFSTAYLAFCTTSHNRNVHRRAHIRGRDEALTDVVVAPACTAMANALTGERGVSPDAQWTTHVEHPRLRY